MSSYYTKTLWAHLFLEEGVKLKVYRCSANKLTSGIGHLLTKAEQETMPEGTPITMDQALRDFTAELPECEKDFKILFGDLPKMAVPRRVALMSMLFQMGRGGVAGFKKMCAAIDKQDWTKASEEALNSKWAEQTNERALRIAAILRTGRMHWPE